MSSPGIALRTTSSLLIAPVFGIIFVILSGFLVTSLPVTFIENYLEAYFIAAFFLGMSAMILLHKFYHQTIVLYIIGLVIAIPLTLIGLVVGFFAYGALQDLKQADVPGEGSEKAVLGGVMMLGGVGISIVVIVIGALSTLSSILGLIAFRVRRLATPNA